MLLNWRRVLGLRQLSLRASLWEKLRLEVRLRRKRRNERLERVTEVAHRKLKKQNGMLKKRGRI